ncbi:MAG: hypothetical protein R3F43_21050 [bacterium]
MGWSRRGGICCPLKYLETFEHIAESPSVKIFLPGGAQLDPVATGPAGLPRGEGEPG